MTSRNVSPRKPLRLLASITAAGLLGIVIALLVSELSSAPPLAPPPPSIAAARPQASHEDERTALARVEQAATQPSAPQTSSLSPELEERLRAAAHFATVPSQAGAPLPPATPLTAEQVAARQQALAEFAAQVQAHLDRCVHRPTELRRPARLDVILQPPLARGALVVQRLEPAAVVLPPDELRRLWHDTDPDALQSCLEEVRRLAVVVPASPKGAARVLPATFESLPITL